MSIIWFLLSLAALITKTGTNAIGESRCYLSSHCMDDNFPFPVIRLTALKCKRRTSCPFIGDNSSCAVNQRSNNYIYLKNIRIKQNKESYWVQVILSSYDDVIKLDSKSLIIKFSFEEDSACYQFLVPVSFFMESKDVVFPCFRIKTLQRHNLGFFFSVHHKTDKIISIQALTYSINNVTDRQWLGGSLFRSIYDFDDESIYFSLNTTMDLKYSFNYSLSIYESHQSDVCDIEGNPVYHRSLTLYSDNHRLNISRHLFSPCQKYCFHTVFSRTQEHGTVHPKHFMEIAFFQLPPPDTNTFYTDDPDTNDCKKWNLTIEVNTIKKNVIATVYLWPKYKLCFSFYLMYLFKFESSTCDPDRGHRVATFNFTTAEPYNKKILKVFQDVSAGYYCILIVPFLNGRYKGDWTTDSGAFNVSEIAVDNKTEVAKKDNIPEFGTQVIVAISFLLSFTAFALWSYSHHIRRSKVKTDKEFSSEKVEECVPLFIDVDEVYLFYSYDDVSVRDEVSLLKNFLKNEAQLKVLTLSDEICKIVEQSDRYINKILECKCSCKGAPCISNKKFLLVVSEKVLRDAEHDLFSENFIWVSKEERAFRMVLESIRADWGKAYCHWFVVAFQESIFEDSRFEKVAPRSIDGAYFTVPNDLINLCKKLGSSSSRDELLNSLELHDIRNVGAE